MHLDQNVGQSFQTMLESHTVSAFLLMEKYSCSTGVNVITAVKILSEIGDIKRFSNANKLAQFAGIAPLHLSSSGKGKDMATKQGNRCLQATIYFLAIQMVQVSSKGTPRNPVVRAYYEKRKAEGKTSQQALICISRRLISIIYGMLKNGTEYRMPVVENAGENR